MEINDRIHQAELAINQRDHRVQGHLRSVTTALTRMREGAGVKLAAVALSLLVGRWLLRRLAGPIRHNSTVIAPLTGASVSRWSLWLSRAASFSAALGIPLRTTLLNATTAFLAYVLRRR